LKKKNAEDGAENLHPPNKSGVAERTVPDHGNKAKKGKQERRKTAPRETKKDHGNGGAKGS